MPYAPCPMPYAQSYLIFLRKAIELLYKTWLNLFKLHHSTRSGFFLGLLPASAKGVGSYLSTGVNSGGASPYASRCITVEAFSHCSTIIFHLFNESWSPVRPFYRLTSFEAAVVYKPDNFQPWFSAFKNIA